MKHNIKTYGFEREFFFHKIGGGFSSIDYLINTKDAGLTLYGDDCGYLVEARGDPSPDVMIAKHMLFAAEEKLAKAARRAGIELHLADTVDLPKEFKRLCLRDFGKNPSESYFMSGKFYNHSRPRAGLHIHFGSQSAFHYTNQQGQSKSHYYSEMVNFPTIIRRLDKAFKEEIKQSRRVPGEYQLKSYGFEYRSLPANIDIHKVADVVSQLVTT